MSDWTVIATAKGHDGIKVASVVLPKMESVIDPAQNADILAQLQDLKEEVAELRKDRTVLMGLVNRLSRPKKSRALRKPKLTGDEAKKEFERIWAAFDEPGDDE